MIQRISITIFITTLWQAGCTLMDVPTYMLPTPTLIMCAFADNAHILWSHGGYTASVILMGLTLACLAAITCGILYAFTPLIERILRPIATIMQSVPSFLFMPFLLLWLGFGWGPKIVIVTLTGFFPLVLAFMDALKRPPAAIVELEALFAHNPLRAFWYLKFPATLPAFFTGLRWACLQSTVAVIAADWLGASQGLGYLILTCYSRLQIPLLFCCVLLLVLYSQILMFGIQKIERRIVFWRPVL